MTDTIEIYASIAFEENGKIRRTLPRLVTVMSRDEWTSNSEIKRLTPLEWGAVHEAFFSKIDG